MSAAWHGLLAPQPRANAFDAVGTDAVGTDAEGTDAEVGATRLPVIEQVWRSQRVLFLGDSITYAAQYVTYFEIWLTAFHDRTAPTIIDAGLPSETVSGLSEEGHAGGQFPRPDLHERLARVLDTVRPNLVFACYGMNCGIYQDWDADRFTKYQAGILRLKKQVAAAGAELILITPPYYDRERTNSATDYNRVLDRYSEWLLGQGKLGWQVIDLHGPMTAEVERRRRTDPQFSFQPDGVHPTAEGQWFISQQLLQACGEQRSTQWKTPAEMLAAGGLDESVLKLAEERTVILRDAFLGAAGHKRPGIAAGLPIGAAEARAAELTTRINRRVAAQRSSQR